MSCEQLKKLISIESVSGNESAILNYVEDTIEQSKYPVYRDKNWVATMIPGDLKADSEAIIINGHVDTVPPGDISEWSSDPYTLTRDNDRLIGLGVSDMKSGIATMLSLLYDYEVRPQKDLWLVFVAGEETNGAGTVQFVEWFKNLDHNYSFVTSIAPEPTNGEYIGIGHRGHMSFSVSVRGQTGHASMPQHIKSHSILTAYKVIEKCGEVNNRWSKEYLHPELGAPTMTVTAISTGGNAVNQFPSLCTVAIDVRTTPQVIDKVTGELDAIAKSFDGVSYSELSRPFPAVATSRTSKVVRKLLDCDPQIEIDSFPGATDLSFMQAISDDFIVFGPGDSAQMHKVNESIRASNLERYFDLIKRLVNSY